MKEKIKVCAFCECEVTQFGDLDYCEDCEMIVEGMGYTKHIEREEENEMDSD